MQPWSQKRSSLACWHQRPIEGMSSPRRSRVGGARASRVGQHNNLSPQLTVRVRAPSAGALFSTGR